MKCHACEIRELRRKNFEESEKKYFSSLKNDSQKREWVGLTDEEIKDILDCGRGGLVDIKKAEQKLKEKNT